MKIYETKIVDLGSEAEMFKEEDMMILFGEEVPDDLANYSYIINVNEVNGIIEKGMTLTFNDKVSYKITAVGEVVNKNLANLGHISLRFNGDTEAELPGTLYLEDKKLPEVDSGTTILIEA